MFLPECFLAWAYESANGTEKEIGLYDLILYFSKGLRFTVSDRSVPADHLQQELFVAEIR
jgi:hypothetical protein